MCGPYAINLFVEIIKRVHYNGKVVDYYDSNTSHVTDLLDKYVIHPEKIDNLVSYVSIIYGPNLKRNKLIDFDIMIAIGAVKSQIYQDVVRGDYILSLPSWSPMYTRTHGVFVGTSIDGRTNCSYGRYEDGSGSSAKKIVQAAGNCFNDALQRWELPYNLNILDKMNYKVELLDSKNTWKKYKGSETHKKFKMDGKHGIYLTLPSGSSATYLPVVARENLDWSINKYMTSLTEKAGGKGNEWINGTIKVYKSQSYIWDAEKQKII
jgi:AMMECR1 domain-containing protein